jgi:exopolysaccharide production protein ExoQ
MHQTQALRFQPAVSTHANARQTDRGFAAVFAAIDPVWCAFVASVTLILLGNFSGTLGAYGFLAVWILLAATRATTSVYAITRGWQVWLFPAFAALSALWSQAHWVTLRFSLEYVATAGCAVLAARLLSPRRLISGLLVCLLMISILCLAIGKTTFNEMTETVDFVGVFESKNELAFFVSLMLLAAMAVLFDRGQGWAFRVLALASLLPVMPLLMKTHSATAKLTAAVSIAVLLGNYTIAQLTSRERSRIIGAAVVMITPLLALTGMAGGVARDFVVHVLGRSSTMTGRTVLWDHAMQLIPQHTLLGWGWQAFWLQNTVDAEGLWAEFHITTRQGFQFQNTFLEAAIELGWIGCGLLAVLLMITTWRLTRWSWRDRSMASSFYVALIVCFLIRSVVEVDILYQFTIGSFMFFVVMCFGFDRGSSKPAVRRARPGSVTTSVQGAAT